MKRNRPQPPEPPAPVDRYDIKQRWTKSFERTLRLCLRRNMEIRRYFSGDPRDGNWVWRLREALAPYHEVEGWGDTIEEAYRHLSLVRGNELRRLRREHGQF